MSQDSVKTEKYQYLIHCQMKTSFLRILKTNKQTIESVIMDFNKPDPLILDGNLSVKWEIFTRDFDNFMIASGKSKKSEELKLSFYLTSLATMQDKSFIPGMLPNKKQKIKN
jgi:hypothetical protein